MRRNWLLKILVCAALALLGATSTLRAQVCAKDVAAGSVFSVVVADDGRVWSFGRNDFGQLGDGTITNSNLPVPVIHSVTSSQLTGGTAVSSGARHTLLLTSGGTVRAWGNNDFGQLGDGTNTSPLGAVDVTGLGSVTITAVAAGAEHSLALDSTGSTWSWGRNLHGELGNGTNVDSSAPAPVLDPSGSTQLTGVVAVAAGTNHSLALLSNSTALVWGRGSEGQLGDGNLVVSNPLPVQALVASVTAIAAADRHSLFLDSVGNVWASGSNNFGVLGNGGAFGGFFSIPALVVDVGGGGTLGGITDVAAGGGLVEHSLALESGGTTVSWGRNCCGQLGNGTTSFGSNEPVQVLDSDGLGPLQNIVKISGGDTHSIALDSSGIVWAWGLNSGGELGDGTTTIRTLPVQSFGFSPSPSTIANAVAVVPLADFCGNLSQRAVRKARLLTWLALVEALLENCQCGPAKKALLNVLNRVDGVAVPPDWICDPTSRAAILNLVNQLMAQLNARCPC